MQISCMAANSSLVQYCLLFANVSKMSDIRL